MSTERRLGISYSRFSDPKQARGDSESRQDDEYRKFCTRHNLTPLAEVFADRGRSGYHDAHRKKGRLGQLIAMAKDGRFEPGTVIVVEAWDRLGRLRPDKRTELVAELLRTGLRIGVCRLDDIFSEDDFGTHKWTTLAVFIQLAYQESKQKAERVARSWEKRRERARTEGQLMRGRLPAWIEDVNGAARLIPERAAAVGRIYQLAAAGNGYRRIIAALHKEGIRPFGPSGEWTRSYLGLILNDRRVVGEYQPCKLDEKSKRFLPDGAVLTNYYPPVVDEETFLLARGGQEQRVNKKDKAMRQGKYVNVFKSILVHARNKEGFMLQNIGTGAAPVLRLVNARGIEAGSRQYTFPYPVFEEAVLGCLRELNPADVLPQKDGAASRADVLRAKLKTVRQEVKRLKEDLKAGYSKAISEVLREQEAAEEETATALQEELARSVKPAEKAWQEFPGLVDMIREAPDPDEVRLKIRPVLRRLVDTIVVLIVPRGKDRFAAVQVFFAGDARRDYLVLNRSAGNGRKASSRVCSPADVARASDLDLRRRADAEALEKLLLAVDLDKLLSAELPKERKAR